MEKLEKHTRLQAQNFIDTPNHILVEKHITDSFPLHWHNYFEIEIILSGKGKHYLNGTEYEISKGVAYLLTTVDFHKIIAEEPIELINISFTEEYMTNAMLSYLNTDTVRVYNFKGEDFENIISAARLLENECKTNGPCITQLCEYILSRFIRSSNKESVYTANSEQLSGIKKAILFIDIHFREKITLPQLAKISGFNPTYFSELFRKVTGETYTQRLNSLRIGYARTLLANGCTVADACFTSGFGSLSSFLSTFKEKCSMTPSEYRKHHYKK